MIIENLTKEDINREVKYEAFDKIEYGKITGWNTRFVFVRYYEEVTPSTGKRIIKTGITSQATSPNDISFCTA